MHFCNSMTIVDEKFREIKFKSKDFSFDDFLHGLRTPRESFFSKIRNFWAWADKLGWNFMRHLGYFWPNYKHYFGTVSPLSMVLSMWWFFPQKTLVFRPKTYKAQKNPKYDIGCKEFRKQPSHVRHRWMNELDD